jgi:5-methylcytosine-specific restriction endonuclease McrA
MAKSPVPGPSPVDRIIAEARRHASEREATYRERALKLYPHVCGRCGREFSGVRLRELTVHHRNHNHDDNPLDGSNWELLCIYCHENEHARVADEAVRDRRPEAGPAPATHNPFADLQQRLQQKNKPGG